MSDIRTQAAIVVDVQADFTEYRNGPCYDFAMCGGSETAFEPPDYVRWSLRDLTGL